MSDTGPLFTGEPDDPLPGLARRIRDAHGLCDSAARKTAESAAEVGRLLAEAKRQVPHGAWIAWVRDNCAFTIRTAQCYLRLAAEMPASNAKRASFLSIRQALGVLAEDGDPRKDRAAVLAGMGAPEVTELVRAMGVEPDRKIVTAAATGWATDGFFLDKLTDEEQSAFKQLPTSEGYRPISAETIASITPPADVDLRPVKRVGRRFNPKDRIGRLRPKQPLVLLEVEGGEVVPADAATYRMLRRRHKEAAVGYDPRRQLIVFRGEAGVEAVLTPQPVGVEGDPAEAVRVRLASIREQLCRMEEVGDRGRIEAVQAAVRLDKIIDELEWMCPDAAPAKQEQPAALQEATAD